MNITYYITISLCIMLSTQHTHSGDDTKGNGLTAPNISSRMSVAELKQRKQQIKHAKMEYDIQWRNHTICECGPCSCTRDLLDAAATGGVYCITCAVSCAALHNTSCDPCVRATGPAIIAYMFGMGAHFYGHSNHRKFDQELEEVQAAIDDKKSQ